MTYKKPPPAEIEVEVVNPRYKGATPLMVAKALLQRPKKAAEKLSEKDEPKGGSE